MSADAWYDCPRCISKLDPATRDALALIQSKGFRLERTKESRTDTMRQDGEIWFDPKTQKFKVDVSWHCTKCGYAKSIKVEQDV